MSLNESCEVTCSCSALMMSRLPPLPRSAFIYFAIRAACLYFASSHCPALWVAVVRVLPLALLWCCRCRSLRPSPLPLLAVAVFVRFIRFIVCSELHLSPRISRGLFATSIQTMITITLDRDLACACAVPSVLRYGASASVSDRETTFGTFWFKSCSFALYVRLDRRRTRRGHLGASRFRGRSLQLRDG